MPSLKISSREARHLSFPWLRNGRFSGRTMAGGGSVSASRGSMTGPRRDGGWVNGASGGCTIRFYDV